MLKIAIATDGPYGERAYEYIGKEFDTEFIELEQPTSMFADEIEFADNVTINPLETLREQLRVLRVKEHRILKRMKAVLDAELVAGKADENGERHPKMVVLTGGQMSAESAASGKSKSASTTSETHEMHYLRLEDAHTKVQGQIRRVLEHIAKVEAEGGEGETAPVAVTVNIVDASRNHGADE